MSATLGSAAVTALLAGDKVECDPSIEECTDWEIVYDEGSFLNTVLLGSISLTLALMPIAVGVILA